MRWWTPDPDSPQLLEWWVPLVRASRRAVREEVPWLILLDEWALEARAERPPRPAVWVYRHRRSHGCLYLDETGQPYRFTPHSGSRSGGQFRETDIRTAVWRADLPSVSQGVWFGPTGWPPDPQRWSGQHVLDDDDPGGRRRALRVVR